MPSITSLPKWNRVTSTSFALALSIVSVSGCSSASKRLDRDMAQEPAVQGRQELRTEATTLIEASGLRSDQKKSLLSLEDKSRKEMDTLQGDSLKLRALLIRNALSERYKGEEVEQIRSRLKTNEESRLALMYDTLDQANNIIGRTDFRDRDTVMWILVSPHTQHEM